jgi:hypothetical protein
MAAAPIIEFLACQICRDHGHQVSGMCDCTGATPVESHITRCVIPCLQCEKGARLAESIRLCAKPDSRQMREVRLLFED